MPDNDEMILEDARDAAFALDKAFRRAIINHDLDTVMELRPKVDDAFDKYSQARLKLLEEGVLASNDDVAEMRRIKAEIDQAANLQAFIQGAIKFAAFIAKFV